MAGKGCLIEFEIALYLPLQGILFDRDAPAVGCHLCPPCRILQKVPDGSAESSHIPDGNQQAGATGPHDLGDPADSEADYGSTASQGLQGCEGEVFLQGRDDKNISGAIDQRAQTVVAYVTQMEVRHLDLNRRLTTPHRDQEEIAQVTQLVEG